MTNIVQLRPKDPESSTVELELDALEAALRDINVELINIEQWDDAGGRDYAIGIARRAVNTAAQRVYRAKLISRGVKVNIPR